MSFNGLRSDFIKLSSSQSIMNDPINGSMFLTLVGSLCHKRGITVERYGEKDLRIHQLIMQDSRTGKGESLKILRKAARYCGLLYTDEVVFTDAGLVGYVDSTVVQTNKKKGLTEDDDDWMNPVVVGDLGIYDIIAFPEGKQMIKTGAYTENLLELLQLAMDTPGHIKKKLLMDEAVEFDSNASFIATTYYTQEFEQVFLEQGIFQRMLVTVRDYDMVDRRALNTELIMGDPQIPTVDFDRELHALCDKIVAAINKVPAGTTVVVNKKGREVLLKRINGWTDYIESEFTGFERKTMASYTTSVLNLYVKVGAIAAVLNGVTEVGPREIASAHLYMKDYMDSITKEILMKVSGVDDTRLIRLIFAILKKTESKGGEIIKGMSRDEVISVLRVKHPDVSEPRLIKTLETMVQNKLVNKGPVTLENGKIAQQYAQREVIK
jgi:hypothetical protein